MQWFENISLSASSVTRRIENMSSNVKEKLKSGVENFEYFSVALDHSTDIQYMIQSAIFVRGINKKLKIMDKGVKLDPL